MLVKMLAIHPTARIGLLTPHKTQLYININAKAAMQIAKVPGVERIQTLTFDASQGEQYDYVVMDLPLFKRAGFLNDPSQADVKRSKSSCAALRTGSRSILVATAPEMRLFSTPTVCTTHLDSRDKRKPGYPRHSSRFALSQKQ